MRISNDPRDAGYEFYASIPDCMRRDIVVTFNRAPVRAVLTADSTTGYLLAYQLDGEGNPIRNKRGDAYLVTELRGEVDIRVPGILQ